MYRRALQLSLVLEWPFSFVRAVLGYQTALLECTYICLSIYDLFGLFIDIELSSDLKIWTFFVRVCYNPGGCPTDKRRQAKF
jgi:hypothetical protein